MDEITNSAYQPSRRFSSSRRSHAAWAPAITTPPGAPSGSARAPLTVRAVLSYGNVNMLVGAWFQNFRIPFKRSVKVTTQSVTTSFGGFYIIVRGAPDLPIVIGGYAVPAARARLNQFRFSAVCFLQAI